MCIKREKKQHMERYVNNNTHHHIYMRIDYNVCYQKNGHKTSVQKDRVTIKKEKKGTYNP